MLTRQAVCAVSQSQTFEAGRPFSSWPVPQRDKDFLAPGFFRSLSDGPDPGPPSSPSCRFSTDVLPVTCLATRTTVESIPSTPSISPAQEWGAGFPPWSNLRAAENCGIRLSDVLLSTRQHFSQVTTQHFLGAFCHQ